jgi:hypothetical protein
MFSMYHNKVVSKRSIFLYSFNGYLIKLILLIDYEEENKFPNVSTIPKHYYKYIYYIFFTNFGLYTRGPRASHRDNGTHYSD